MARTTIPAELVAVNAIQGTLIADNSITAVHIATNAISGTLVADNAVTSTHIAQNNVTATQIAQNTITVTQMADDAIETAKINASAVTTAKINNGAVTGDKLAANSVTSANIVNGTIVAADLGDNAVTIAKMASLARGKIIYGDSAGDPAALALGSAGTFLISDGTDISWGNSCGGLETTQTVAKALSLAGTYSGGNYIEWKKGGAAEFYIGSSDTVGAGSGYYDLYAVAGKGLRFFTGAGERMRITSAGRVGIGTNDPGTLLELRTDTSSSSYGSYPALSIRNDNAAGYSAIHFQEGSTQRARVEVGNNSGTPYMGLYTTSGALGITIKGGGVGIGETSPETSLHIKNAGNSFLTLERSGTTGGSGKFGINMEGGSSQQTTMAYDDGGKLVIGRSSDPATQAGFSNDFVLDSSGNVGIGDDSPGHKLEVKSTENYKAIHIKGTNAPCYTMSRGDATDAEWRMGLSGYDYNDFAISSSTGTNDRFRIDPDGNMILGSANNITPIDMHKDVATVSVSGPIAMGYSAGTYAAGPRNLRDWFVYAGPTSGQSRYVHMKTDLWAGGSPSGNTEYTMSLFRYHSAYSYGNAKVSEGMIGWHNWSGATTHQRIIHNPVSNWAIVKESYTSSDGYVVLVADILTSGSYTQFSIDWCQWSGYPFRERKVTAVTLNASATGAY